MAQIFLDRPYETFEISCVTQTRRDDSTANQQNQGHRPFLRRLNSLLLQV